MKSAPIVTSLVVLCTALCGALHPAQAQDSSALEGGWIVTSWTSADGEVNSEPQSGLFLFTATGQYSMMYINTAEPRGLFSEDTTDEEALAIHDAFTANSGRYTVEGSQIKYEAYMAKFPNYMSEFMTDEGNAVTLDYSIEDGTLTLHWTGDNGRTATLRRPGQGG